MNWDDSKKKKKREKKKRSFPPKSMIETLVSSMVKTLVVKNPDKTRKSEELAVSGDVVQESCCGEYINWF